MGFPATCWESTVYWAGTVTGAGGGSDAARGFCPWGRSVTWEGRCLDKPAPQRHISMCLQGEELAASSRAEMGRPVGDRGVGTWGCHWVTSTSFRDGRTETWIPTPPLQVSIYSPARGGVLSPSFVVRIKTFNQPLRTYLLSTYYVPETVDNMVGQTERELIFQWGKHPNKSLPICLMAQ